MHVRLAHGHIGGGLLLGGDGIGVFLLADGVGLDQWLVAFGQCRGLRQVGFGACLAGPGAGSCGGIGRCIDREQRLARLHIAAFAEQAFLQDAGSTRPHLCDPRGFQAARQFSNQADIARRHRDHADLGRRRGTRTCSGRIALAATGQKQGKHSSQHERLAKSESDGQKRKSNAGRGHIYSSDLQEKKGE